MEIIGGGSLLGSSDPTPEKILENKINDALFRLSLNALKDKPNESAVVSPFSIAMALATVNVGAAGTTSQEITDVAFGGVDKNEVAKFFKNKLEDMSRYQESPLDIASAIYMEKAFPVLDKFKSDVTDSFKSDLEQVDFREDPQAQRSLINKYVEKNTGGHIKDLFGQDDIHVNTKIVAVNALYMKAAFHNKFRREQTKDVEFHNEDGSNKMVPTMHDCKEGNFFENEDYAFANIKFVEHGFQFFIAVPKSVSLGELKSKFVDSTHNFASTHSEALFIPYLHIAVPKFNVDASYGLVEALKQLGINEMFDTRANFKGITDAPIAVDSVIHKAILELDEDGVTAAAVTAMGITLLSACLSREERHIKADKPFLYGVTYQGSPIFVGQYY